MKRIHQVRNHCPGPVFFCRCIFCLCIALKGHAQTNAVHDKDGNVYPVKRMPDKKIWMTSNLKIQIPGSYDYDTVAPANHVYGRVYTWQSAQEGCTLLGGGWHLPTNQEWQTLAKWFGGVRDDSEDEGKSAYLALITGGKAAFNAVYGGRRDTSGNFSRVDAHGFYWTATETGSANAWFYNFGKNGKILNHHPEGEKQVAISVRCLRDAGIK